MGLQKLSRFHHPDGNKLIRRSRYGVKRQRWSRRTSHLLPGSGVEDRALTVWHYNHGTMAGNSTGKVGVVCCINKSALQQEGKGNRLGVISVAGTG